VSLERRGGEALPLPIDPIGLGLSIPPMFDAERAPLPLAPGLCELRIDPATSAQGPVRKRDCDARAWLRRVHRLCDEGQTRPAVRLVLDMFDDLFFAGNLARCDEILRLADENRMPAPVVLAFLTVTAPARSELSGREHFFRRARARLLELRPKEKVDALLARLG
jgi:hypothetical protein